MSVQNMSDSGNKVDLTAAADRSGRQIPAALRITKTGINVASVTTATQSALPTTLSGAQPDRVRMSATQVCYAKFMNPGVVQSDVDVAVGTGYVPGEVLTLAGGTALTTAKLAVTTTQLVTAAILSGGTGHAANDVITLAGGTSSVPAKITVDTVDGSGVILTSHVSTPGSYTVDTTSFTQASTTGTGVGATFDTAVYGVLLASVNVAGSYSVEPSNPVSVASTTGSGTGATFDLTFDITTTVATSSDTMISPGDAVVMDCYGFTRVSVIREAVDGKLQISPIENNA